MGMYEYKQCVEYVLEGLLPDEHCSAWIILVRITELCITLVGIVLMKITSRNLCSLHLLKSVDVVCWQFVDICLPQ